MEQENQIKVTDDFTIQEHNFQRNKKALQKFSQQTHISPSLSRVETDGTFWGFTEHNVTGTELNKITKQIQSYLVEYNTLHANLINEFGVVYKTFEALDKDYMQCIVFSVKGLEKQQKDIGKTIEQLKKVTEVLQQYKKKIEAQSVETTDAMNFFDEQLKKLDNEVNASHLNEIADKLKLAYALSGIAILVVVVEAIWIILRS